MDNSLIKAKIAEFYRTREDVEKEGSILLEAAFFLEDVFKVRLNDDEITAENLAAPGGMEKLVLSKI